MSDNRSYIAIDLKSFYASVECMERNLDPLTTNLVVADGSKTSKTICLAVTPSLKSYGISGRARLFQVIQTIKEANIERKGKTPKGIFTGKSYDANELKADLSLEIDYVIAPPRMAKYMEISTKIYEVYLKYIAPEDIHVYSIDEVLIDATSYLNTYQMSPKQLASTIIKDVEKTTGITATAGIGTNLYLCKIALDIVAKHTKPNEEGTRIAELNEMSYRKLLWDHRPITDFWRVGKGYAKKLAQVGIYTMGDVARCSIGKVNEFYNEDLLYQLFGVNAELLIDHAWGYEPCTMTDIKEYKPEEHSIGAGQVLGEPYTYEKAKLVVREMAELLVLDLVKKGFVTEQMVLTVGYDRINLTDPNIKKLYKGEVTTDAYGRAIPKHAHGTIHLESYTSSTVQIREAVTTLFERIVNPNLLVRRMQMFACRVLPEKEMPVHNEYEQLSLFTMDQETREKKEQEKVLLEKERKMQKAILQMQKKFGKNAILKGMNLQEGATAKERNGKVGGHKA